MPAKKKPVKKTVAKKPAPKKVATKKSVPRKSSAASASNTSDFMQTKFTEQTVYWLIIGVAVIALAAWVLSLQVQLNQMYDDIDAASSSYVAPKPNL
jgi:hypothetical protein